MAAILPDIEDRAVIARRYREIFVSLVDEQGGPDRLSEARRQLTRRFAACAVLAEQMEARLLRGEEIDVTEHAVVCSTLVRVARQIGIDRIAPDTKVPTLATIMAEDD